MNLASKIASVSSTTPSSVAAIHRFTGWNAPLHVGDVLTRVFLVPAPVEVLGHGAKLNDQFAARILRLDFSPLFPPEPQQRPLHRSPMMIRASEPPMKARRSRELAIRFI